MGKLDTDEALRGSDGVSKARRAFVDAPEHKAVAEREAMQRWFGCLAGASEVKATPAAIAYERSLIGHLLAEPREIAAAGDHAQPAYFSQAECGAVMRVLVELVEAGRPVDDTSVVEALARSKVQAPWSDVLSTCREAHTTASTAEEKARLVGGCYRNRRLAAIGAALYHRAAGATASDFATILDDVTSEIVALEEPAYASVVDTGIGDASQAVIEDVRRRMETKELPGLRTGWSRMDWFLAGYGPNKLIVVKAATGVGKTAFAMTTAVAVARLCERSERGSKDDRTVAVVSLEMTDEQVALRALSNVGAVDGMDVRLATIGDAQVDRLVRAHREMTALNERLRIRYAPGQTLPSVRRYLTRLHRKRPLGLVIVDYAQLLCDNAGKHKTREQEVAAISTALKEMAGRFGCTIMALSQMNADGATRESKRLEQDADAIIKVGPAEDGDENADLEFVYDVVIEKNRFGLTTGPGKYQMVFFKRFQRFAEISQREEPGWFSGGGKGTWHDED